MINYVSIEVLSYDTELITTAPDKNGNAYIVKSLKDSSWKPKSPRARSHSAIPKRAKSVSQRPVEKSTKGKARADTPIGELWLEPSHVLTLNLLLSLTAEHSGEETDKSDESDKVDETSDEEVRLTNLPIFNALIKSNLTCYICTLGGIIVG